MKYTIPMLPPSLNRFAGRKNYQEYRTLKSKWKFYVGLFCTPRPKSPPAKAVVKITYFFPTKTRHDPDNYAGKMILDGLTEAGVIKDDSFGCIELRLAGEYDPDNPRTEIEVYEYPT